MDANWIMVAGLAMVVGVSIEVGDAWGVVSWGAGVIGYALVADVLASRRERKSVERKSVEARRRRFEDGTR